MKTFFLQTKLYSGQDSLEALQRFHKRNIWIICDPFIATSPLLERLKQFLPQDNQLSLFHNITSDPNISSIVDGIKEMGKIRPEIVIGFGGGSALDAAKAIVWFSRKQGIEIESCVAIPTTSGTGSEVSNACVISDPTQNIKYPLFDDALYSDMTILDPSLVISVPAAITANTGLDVLTHALEAYVSINSSDFTDAMAEKAVQLVFQYLPVAYNKGGCLVTRGKMHNASTMAGIAFNHAGLGLNHAIAHQLGAQFHIPHGLANALLLTSIIRFNAQDERARHRYARLARLCHLSPMIPSNINNRFATKHHSIAANRDSHDHRAVNQLIQQIERLKRHCQIPRSLSALKISENQLQAHMDEMIVAAHNDATSRTNPRIATDEQIREIIEGLYDE